MDGESCGNPAQDMFHFDIGEPPRRFSIRRTLLRCVSRPLSALVSNGMRESQEGCVRLEDVEIQTFSRFVEWLLTDTYSVPGADDFEVASGKEDECHIDVKARPAPLLTEEMNGDVCPTLGEQRYPHLRAPARQFHQKGTSIGSISPQNSQGGQTQARLPDAYESTLHFQCFVHAKLYIFADRRQIFALQRLAAERLQEILQTLEQSDEQATLITSLVDYAYENTARLSLEDNGLRRVSVQSTVEQLERLIHSPVFLDLLEAGGQFVKDLVCELAAGALRREQQHAALEDAANHWQVFIANAAY